MRPLPFLAMFVLIACGGEGGGSGWSSMDVRLDGTGAADSFDAAGVRICRSTTADVFAVWEDDRLGPSAIWLQHSADGGHTWREAPIKVNRGEASATRPALACSGQTVYVVWEDIRDGDLENKNIYFNRSTSSGDAWASNDLRLSPDPDGRAMALRPRIVAAGSNLHVLWSDNRSGAFDIFTSSSSNSGESFADPVRVNSNAPGSAFSAFPELVADSSGRVVIVWEDARSGNNDIYGAVSSDGGSSYSSDIRLDTGVAAGFANSFKPQIAMEGDEVYVAWQDERNGTERDIYFNYSGGGGATWLEAARQVETDGAGAGDSAAPAVAVGGGVGHIAWQDRRSGGFDIYYRSFTQAEPRRLEMEREGRETADAELRLNLGDRAGASNALEPRIATEGSNVVVVWEDRRFDGVTSGGSSQGFNEVFYNYSTDGGQIWQTNDLKLDSYCSGRKYANGISLALHEQSVLAAWIDGRRGWANAMFSRKDFGDEGETPPAGSCNL